MKKILLSALVLSIATLLNAQNIMDNSTRFSVSFGLMSTEDSDDSDYGIQASYLYSFNIANQNLPLFLQFGPEVNWLTYSENNARETVMNLATPLNLAYRIGLSDNLYLEPFAGVSARVNLVGKLTYDGKEVADFFDDLDAKRFQMGLNVGLGLNFNGKYLGYRYNHDLMNYLSAINSKTDYHFFTIGFNF